MEPQFATFFRRCCASEREREKERRIYWYWGVSEEF
jgi:hypothetical protein